MTDRDPLGSPSSDRDTGLGGSRTSMALESILLGRPRFSLPTAPAAHCSVQLRGHCTAGSPGTTAAPPDPVPHCVRVTSGRLSDSPSQHFPPMAAEPVTGHGGTGISIFPWLVRGQYWTIAHPDTSLDGRIVIGFQFSGSRCLPHQSPSLCDPRTDYYLHPPPFR